jgi:hypothetical protein
MPAPTSRAQRTTDREFRQLTRQLQRTSPVTWHWRSGPSDARDVRVTGHDDRRCPPVVAAVAGSLLLALVAIVTSHTPLAVVVALVGLALCSILGHDQARTHLTVTEDGRVVVGNGIHRRMATVPTITVARISLPVLQRSRWNPRRPVGHLLLHSGEVLPVRALAFDGSREEDHRRAAVLLRVALRACADGGAVLDVQRV